MSTPQLNPVGYRNSSVKDMEGFKNVDFALAHGSGDDNGALNVVSLLTSSSDDMTLTLSTYAVHYLNTAALLDRFTSAQVR
jgi:dipeptidyl aminopeptidase B